MKTSPHFVTCIDNSEYPASLEMHKIYLVLPDKEAQADGDLRIIDENGEDFFSLLNISSNCLKPPPTWYVFYSNLKQDTVIIPKIAMNGWTIRIWIPSSSVFKKDARAMWIERYNSN
jgi:hypothetical protein